MTNIQLLQEFETFPVFFKISARRVGWLQDFVKRPDAHAQASAAIFGKLIIERGSNRWEDKNLDKDGHLLPSFNQLAKSFSEGLALYEGISRTRDFFSLW